MSKIEVLKNALGLGEEDKIDEGVENLRKKIHSEIFSIIFIFLCIYYLYNLIILNTLNYSILIILGISIYEEIRLSFNKVYTSNSISQIINFGLLVMAFKYCFELMLVEVNFTFLGIVSLVITFIYNKILIYINEK